MLIPKRHLDLASTVKAAMEAGVAALLSESGEPRWFAKGKRFKGKFHPRFASFSSLHNIYTSNTFFKENDLAKKVFEQHNQLNGLITAFGVSNEREIDKQPYIELMDIKNREEIKLEEVISLLKDIRGNTGHL
ncbi:hypothetical protein D0469_14620 [Peribacillus saganii]|uniref:Uncharacterized protein n=1 Tax=Peribacillus saganii TaxID=2303992 RepID=A0A372LM62_9BACI|nr:hypothetical protein [Peribacillus saganii]RFU67484.1 hypothetical protein D0469_14620 [Peribacillus saganii]